MKRHHRQRTAEKLLAPLNSQSSLSVYLKEVIYGGVDGIITTFAVVAGFSGAAFSNESAAQLSFLMVLLFGLANLFADGISMGLGNFLAVRSEQSLYCSVRSKEKDVSEQNSGHETQETKLILMAKGFSEEDALTLTNIYKKNEKFWVDFLMSYELKMTDPTDEKPLLTGTVTFLSFVIFGCIPLIPFVIFGAFEPQTVFEFSAGGAIIALVMLGILKWRVIGTGLVRSVGEVVLVGSAAASIAFLVGTLFTF